MAVVYLRGVFGKNLRQKLNKLNFGLTILTVIVVTHADVVADHVRHRPREQMRLVRIDIYTNAYGLGRADGFRHGHAGFTARVRFAPVNERKSNITSKF